MKRMMFNDRFGLTDAVIQKRKTVTRRANEQSKKLGVFYGTLWYNRITYAGNKCRLWNNQTTFLEFDMPYQKGEIVAVAQSYQNAGYAEDKIFYRYIKEHDGYLPGSAINDKGWGNKMFVCADLMPHQIRILDVRAEKLQDITEEDCLREYPDCDIIRERHVNNAVSMGASVVDNWMSRRDVFAWLIDKISGKGTWKSNPFVWRIEFELISK